MFDHGAQYFTIKSPEVQQLVDHWEASGLVSEWKGKFGTVNVATGTLVEDKVSLVSAFLASPFHLQSWCVLSLATCITRRKLGICVGFLAL